MAVSSVDTQSLTQGGRVISRKIISVKLKPGMYEVTVATLRETKLPEGIGTYLHIGFYPKASVIKNNE